MIDPRVPGRRHSSPSAERLARPTASAKTSVSAAVSEDEVRIHAYLLYERRLSERRLSERRLLSEDRSVEDWLAAEAHLKARKNRANKTTVR